MSDHNTPDDLRYTKDHEWVRVDGDTITVGIDDYAQQALGELVYVELPEIGATFERGADMAVVESFKTASDVMAPVGGEVIAVNGALSGSPQTVNESPYDDGWLIKMTVDSAGELEDLMDSDTYVEQLED